MHCSKSVYAGVSVYLSSVTRGDVEKVYCKSSPPLPPPLSTSIETLKGEKKQTYITHTEEILFFCNTHTQAILSDADFAQIRKCGKCIVLYAATT